MAAGEVISSLKGLNSKVESQEINVFAVMPAILDFLQKSHDYVYNFNQDGSGIRDSDVKRREYPGDDGLYDTEDDKDVIMVKGLLNYGKIEELLLIYLELMLKKTLKKIY